MKKNKWVLLLIAFVAFLVLVYFIGACHDRCDLRPLFQ